VDKGTAVDIFNMDFAKAFNKVPRRRLIEKLRAKGIEEGTVKWTNKWLMGRQCYGTGKFEDGSGSDILSD
jgi:hypothetical protein